MYISILTLIYNFSKIKFNCFLLCPNIIFYILNLAFLTKLIQILLNFILTNLITLNTIFDLILKHQ